MIMYPIIGSKAGKTCWSCIFLNFPPIFIYFIMKIFYNQRSGLRSGQNIHLCSKLSHSKNPNNLKKIPHKSTVRSIKWDRNSGWFRLILSTVCLYRALVLSYLNFSSHNQGITIHRNGWRQYLWKWPIRWSQHVKTTSPVSRLSVAKNITNWKNFWAGLRLT